MPLIHLTPEWPWYGFEGDAVEDNRTSISCRELGQDPYEVRGDRAVSKSRSEPANAERQRVRRGVGKGAVALWIAGNRFSLRKRCKRALGDAPK